MSGYITSSSTTTSSDLSNIFAPYVSGTKVSNTNIRVNNNDLSNIFAPYVSGTKASTTNIQANSNDLANIFAPYVSGTKASTTNIATTVTTGTTITLYFAASVRLVNPNYTGAVMTVRNGTSGTTQDFYSDKMQTYLTTGPGNTGTSYATWIGANQGFITKLYDQSNNGNHLIQNTNANQPQLVLNSGKYVMKMDNTKPYFLNITTAMVPKTIFTQFYNNFAGEATIICAATDYGQRFGQFGVPSNQFGLRILGDGNNSDYYNSATGTKLVYANGVNITSTLLLSGLNVWQTLSISVTTPFNLAFTKVGTDGFSKDRGINGFMVEMICHNSTIDATGMQNYYADRLI
jgi:hypothetical protein